MPDFKNPQVLNRYSYVVNNPLKYTDPSGHVKWDGSEDLSLARIENQDTDFGWSYTFFEQPLGIFIDVLRRVSGY